MKYNFRKCKSIVLANTEIYILQKNYSKHTTNCFKLEKNIPTLKEVSMFLQHKLSVVERVLCTPGNHLWNKHTKALL